MNNTCNRKNALRRKPLAIFILCLTTCSILGNNPCFSARTKQTARKSTYDFDSSPTETSHGVKRKRSGEKGTEQETGLERANKKFKNDIPIRPRFHGKGGKGLEDFSEASRRWIFHFIGRKGALEKTSEKLKNNTPIWKKKIEELKLLAQREEYTFAVKAYKEALKKQDENEAYKYLKKFFKNEDEWDADEIADCSYQLGLIAAKKENLEKTIKFFTEACDLSTDGHSRASYSLGLLADYQGHTKDAKGHFERSDLPEARYHLGLIYEEKEKFDKARKNFKQAAQENYEPACEKYGFLLLSKAKEFRNPILKQHAIDYLERVEDRPEVTYQLGILYKKDSDLEKAQEKLESAMSTLSDKKKKAKAAYYAAEAVWELLNQNPETDRDTYNEKVREIRAYLKIAKDRGNLGIKMKAKQLESFIMPIIVDEQGEPGPMRSPVPQNGKTGWRLGNIWPFSSREEKAVPTSEQEQTHTTYQEPQDNGEEKEKIKAQKADRGKGQNTRKGKEKLFPKKVSFSEEEEEGFPKDQRSDPSFEEEEEKSSELDSYTLALRGDPKAQYKEGKKAYRLWRERNSEEIREETINWFIQSAGQGHQKAKRFLSRLLS